MRVIDRLLVFYMLALGVLFASLAVNYAMTERLSAQVELDATDINKSGRQRMLSQRIIYLALELSDNPNAATRAALFDAIAEFEAALDLFEASHDALSGRTDLDPRLAEIYFSDADGASLDSRVKRYIALGREVARDPRDAESLQGLRAIEQSGLLADLDAAVTLFEALSNENVSWIRQAEYASLLVAAAIVLLEVALVFLPGHRFIQSTLRDLSRKNEMLDVAAGALAEKNARLVEQADALERERVRLQLACETSEALRREQAEFTYAVSHDLKSPANTMSVLIDEIDHAIGDGADADMREMLDHAHRTIRRMGDHVEDVLAYAWSTDGREEVARIDLGAVVEAALADLDDDIRTAGAVVSVAQMGEVRGYRRQLEMLVKNLVSNAIRYRDPERAPEISINFERSGTRAAFLSVTDNGIGIAAEHRERIFGMFQRLHRQDEVTGSGLGLCTCKRIAENHGGGIDVRSEPGVGTTFTVRLALDLAETSETGRMAA